MSLPFQSCKYLDVYVTFFYYKQENKLSVDKMLLK